MLSEHIAAHVAVCRPEISRIIFIGAKNTSYIQSDLFNKLVHQYLKTALFLLDSFFKCLNLSFATPKSSDLLSFKSLLIAFKQSFKVLLHWEVFMLGKREIAW